MTRLRYARQYMMSPEFHTDPATSTMGQTTLATFKVIGEDSSVSVAAVTLGNAKQLVMERYLASRPQSQLYVACQLKKATLWELLSVVTSPTASNM